MEPIERRLDQLESCVAELDDWRNQVNTLLAIIVGAAEPIIEQDGDTR